MGWITSWIVSIVLTISFQSCNGYEKFNVIDTEYGLIKGQLLLTKYDAKPYYSYRGIPYTMPPLNELRFKVPKPPKPRTTVLDAFEYGNECIQKNLLFGNNQITGSEDCLYLNVFTPILESNNKLPVMVWIHGGGYFEGSANAYRPDFLLNNDVIVVSINYRLGPFGFLSLGTADYSGNNGLKDQLFALQWVQRNIEQFGGDKDSVTIFGESAGSASTHFHVLSPKSQGLFKRAIMQSGSALNIWASHTKSDHLDFTYKLAREFGHNPLNTDDVKSFLQRVDAKVFTQNALPDCYVHGRVPKEVDLIWTPIAEVADAKEPFLTKLPHEYVYDTTVNQSIDTLHGFVTAEMMFLTLPELVDPSLLSTLNQKFELQFPRLDLQNDYKSEDYKKMAKEIRDFYFGKHNGQINENSIKGYNDMMSDAWFVYGIDRGVKAQVYRTTGKVFYYQFSLDTKLNIVKTGLGRLPSDKPFVFPGTSHIEDLFYVFYFDFPNTNLNELYDSFTVDSIERKLIKMVTKLWTDFAKYGNPTPDSIDFKPVRKDEINYIDITNDGLRARVQPFSERIKFWDQFYGKYEQTLRKMSTPPRDEL